MVLLVNCQFMNRVNASESDIYNLNIVSENIYSITVTPNKSHGATNYSLKIYSKEDQKKPVVNITHPLQGQITDVDIYDFDKDGDQNLIIQTTDMSSNARPHYDVYEFKAKNLFDIIRQYF